MRSLINTIFKRHFWLVLFLITITLFTGFKLVTASRPLYDWDESLYVENGIEMIRHRSFLVPLWQGHPWLDKPPLSPLLFGLITQLPVPVEISTRLFTLALSLIALSLAYALYYKASRSKNVALLSTIITFFLPIYLQRSQVVSLDVTLLIGWLGYWLFHEKPVIAALFLFLSVQSKSLLGFYPLAIDGIYYGWLFVTHNLSWKKLLTKVKIMTIQVAFLSLWYLAAFFVFKGEFWQLHIIESHFRRVSSSLESHFGQRTFYLDLAISQLNWLSVLSLIGFLLSFFMWTKKKISHETFLLQNAFLPWFVFLNLTKTKISWYLYPVLPQFAFYAALPFSFIPKKLWQTTATFLFAGFLIYNGIFTQQFFTTFYSDNDPHIKIAKTAKDRCQNLAVLVPNYTRETFNTLKKMNLTITTTNWWGEHPSMVFYFKKPLKFFYSTTEFTDRLPTYQCAALNPDDQNLVDKKLFIKTLSFDKMVLYQKLK